MKNLSKLLLLSIAFFVSCAKSENITVLEPVVVEREPVAQEPVDFPVTETREPYFTIDDKGFEALLILYNVDTDNQINGKVSEEDILTVKDLGYILNGSPSLKAEFIKDRYGEIPKIVDFSDIRHFSNLRYLGVHGGTEINLAMNSNLEKIEWIGGVGFKTLDVRELSKLKIIQCYPSTLGTHQPGEIQLKNNNGLEVIHYSGTTTAMDFSQAPNLKELSFSTQGSVDSVLDLSKNIHLEKITINFRNPNNVKVRISPETMKKVNSDPLRFKIPATAIWTL
jgi:hypothetical protein